MANILFDSPLAKKVNTFVSLLPDELKCLADMQANPIKVKRGQQLTHEGQTGHKAFVLQTGWACSYKLLPDGGRQIISFPIAGDIVGLRSILLRTADHSFSALTDATINPVEGTHIVKCMTEFPRLVRPSCGPLRATKPWLSNTSSTSVGAMPSNARPTSSWNWPSG